MPTPIMNFRLVEKERLALIEMSKLYGAENVSEFLRDMVGAMCSGDVARIQAFNARLIRAAGEQLILKLNTVVEAEREPASVKKMTAIMADFDASERAEFEARAFKKPKRKRRARAKRKP